MRRSRDVKNECEPVGVAIPKHLMEQLRKLQPQICFSMSELFRFALIKFISDLFPEKWNTPEPKITSKEQDGVQTFCDYWESKARQQGLI